MQHVPFRNIYYSSSLDRRDGLKLFFVFTTGVVRASGRGAAWAGGVWDDDKGAADAVGV